MVIIYYNTVYVRKTLSHDARGAGGRQKSSWRTGGGSFLGGSDGRTAAAAIQPHDTRAPILYAHDRLHVSLTRRAPVGGESARVLYNSRAHAPARDVSRRGGVMPSRYQ